MKSKIWDFRFEIGRQGNFKPRHFARLLALVLLAAFVVGGQPRQGRGQLGVPAGDGLASADRGLAATLERLRRFEHITRILYITAHPDDENAALLAYLSRGLGAEVAQLTLTRGEGGQNLMSADQGLLLGLVRTEELLAADRQYGIEQQFFTHAIDFGYTTNAQETLSRWGDPPLADMVRVIRAHRPDVVISRWTGTALDGHGHHQAAALLARHAVAAAADPNEFPDQLAGELATWQVARFFMEVAEPAPDVLALPVGSFSFERGRPYSEIGRAGYANHRTQFAWAALRSQLPTEPQTGMARGGPVPAAYLRYVEENRPQPQMTDLAERLDLLPVRYAFLEVKPEPAPGATPIPSAAERLGGIHQAVERIRALLLEAKPEEALRALGEIRAHLEALASDPALDRLDPPDSVRLRNIYERKQNELDALAVQLAGLRVEAFAESPAIVGQDALVKVRVRADPEAHVELSRSGDGLSLRLPPEWQASPLAGQAGPEASRARLLSVGPPRPVALAEGKPGGRTEKEDALAAEGTTAVFSVAIPAEAARPLLVPVPREAGQASADVYAVADPAMAGQALQPQPVIMEAIVRFLAGGMTWQAPPVPVTFRPGDAAKRVSGERILQPVPPFLLRLPDRIVIRHESGETGRIVFPVAVQNLCDPAAAGCRNARLGAEAPEGWMVSVSRKINFARPGDEALGQLSIIPPRALAPGDYSVRCFVESEGRRYDTAFALYGYADLDERTYYHRAEVTIRVVHLDVPEGLRIGYIAGANDPVPAALERVGVTVEQLGETDLAFEEAIAWLRYDALVIGIRALELRREILSRPGRWLEYVQAGGTLVVLYQSPQAWNAARGRLAPLPATMDERVPIRITDPKAPVRIVLPNHELLLQPNRISPEDFSGWVMERGLSFLSPTGRDAQYQAPLAFRDATGAETDGGLVYARVGKGIFIYTGLSFFRQLPAGVPGAYRLVLNLISQGRYPKY